MKRPYVLTDTELRAYGDLHVLVGIVLGTLVFGPAVWLVLWPLVAR